MAYLAYLNDMIKFIRNSIAILIITSHFSISYGQSCRALFNRTSIEESLDLLDSRVSLYKLEHFDKSGMERLRFVGQIPVLQKSTGESYPQRTLELAIENILTSRTAGQTRLEMRIGQGNEAAHLFGNQAPTLLLSGNKITSEVTVIPAGAQLRETYRLESKKAGISILVTISFVAKGSTASLVPMPDDPNQSRIYRKPQQAGEAPGWELLGGSFQIEPPAEK